MKPLVKICFPVLVAFLASCANQVAPTGGEKDTKPPKALKFSPKNYSTQFSSHDIGITFDEYIQLKDLSAQLIVSPPLKNAPTTKIKKKTLFIHLEDTLQNNTTYTLNFGNAVADNNEGNVLENFQYVFATGDIIDSLHISGKAENAFDKKTEKGVFVMLYKSFGDSLPLKKFPDYFTKTNVDGNFKVTNVSEGNYKIIALKDTNSNYLFDTPAEYIAFSDSAVASNQSGVVLRYFKEKAKQHFLRSFSDEPGKATLVYALPLQNASFEFLNDTSMLKVYSINYSEKRDSITIWYRNQLSDSLNMIVHHDKANDTLVVRLRRIDAKGKFKYIPELTSNYASGSTNVLNQKAPLELLFNHPIEKGLIGKITLMEDSAASKNHYVYFSDTEKRRIVIANDWKEKTKYTVFIPPGTLTDIFGTINDTLQYTFKTKALTDYGTLMVKLQIPVQDKNYLLQLIDEKETVYRQSFVNTDTTLHFDFLDPKAYRIKLIEDTNENGEWDTGNYLRHIQPEPVFYYKDMITVRANWDVDVKWKAE